MSNDSIPTFSYRQSLAAALDDQMVVPVNVNVGWLSISCATTGEFPEEVEQSFQIRFGAGQWQLFTTPVAFSAMKIQSLGCVPHSAGIYIRTPALAGLQLIAQGGP
jgi:hypothetical protein